jgi:Protein of unknown function (DUF4236)
MAFRLRFRHSFTIIPKFLKFTLNKKSWSLNLTIGPYSRSWGSARSTTTIDAPGALGFSWRDEHSHGDGGFESLWILLVVLLLVASLLVQTGLLFWQTTLAIGPAAAISTGLQLATLCAVFSIRKRGWSVPLTFLLCAAQGAAIVLWA